MRTWGALLSVVLAGCDSGPTGPDHAVRVTAEVSSREFRVGDTVSVRVIATNTGTKTASVAHSSCRPDFDVLYGAEKVHPHEGFACLTIGMRVRKLVPGAADTVTYRWAGTIQPVYVPGPVALRGGEYEVRGRAIVEETVVESERVPLRILP